MSETLSIALSGLNDAALRVMVSSRNIANSMTTGRLPSTETEKAGSYEPKDVVTLSESVGDANLGVRSEIRDREPAYSPAPDPRSPFANEQGLVAAPNVDVAAELVQIKMANTAYRANAAVIKATLENDQKLLDALK